MGVLRSSILSGGLLLALCCTASADSDWQTVSLDNDPDFTIDVPTFIGNDYKPDAKSLADGELMFYAATSKTWGDMYCSVYRVDYSKYKMSRDDFVAKLAAGAGAVLCMVGDKASGYENMGSKSLASNGLPASLCTASFTASGDEDPGQVVSVLLVAGRSHAFEVQCEHDTDTQQNAEGDWSYFWVEDATHVQQSLHLPKSEQ